MTPADQPGAETPPKERHEAAPPARPEQPPGEAPGQLAKAEAAAPPATSPVPVPGFTAALAEPFVSLKLGFPSLWPETVAKPFQFKLEYLLTEDADREQSAFLKLGENERAAETYRYDCRLLALLSVYPPEGFLDFPEMPSDFNPDNPTHREHLTAAVFAYLYRPGDRSARAFAYLARQFMSRYWQRIAPRDYL